MTQRTPEETQLWTMLTAARDQGQDLTRRGYAYQNPYDFVLQHGGWYAPRRRPRGVPLGVPHCCFGNAIVAAVQQGLRYVEGFALMSRRAHDPRYPRIVFPHAWGTDAQGRLYEVTWTQPGLAYLGVVFAVERADDCTWNGDATVLDDRHRGWPLLRERWAGEPAVGLWAASPRLELIQRGDGEAARRWLREQAGEAPHA